MLRCISVLRVFFLTTLVALGTSACDAAFKKLFDEALAEGKLPPDEMSPSDEDSTGRAYRAITLDNGLVAFLIHDPEANKSAAAMSVAVGSLENPDAHLGLAHFLEHMVFMGTTKYPEVGEYDQYVSSYQGYTNAYTSGEETNYYFEVNHEGFVGSLDRFAQLVVAPLFLQEHIEREVNAVHNEHQKNLQSDLWRTYRISGLTSKDGHPRQRFATGDKETLKNANREVIVDFYNRYYSANIMKLATISSLSLDEQEEQVRTVYADLPNNNRGKLTYDADIYDDNLLPQRIEIEPVTDVRQVVLSFEMPSGHDYWQSKPDHLLSALIGDEGKGSLLSLLKERGYATALLSGLYSSSYVGEFEVEITLTEKGLTEVNEVVALFFSYITMLKKESLKEYFYNESKQLAQIGYDYRAPLDGADAVIYYANVMHRFAPLDALRNDSLFFKHAPHDFRLFLNKITPRKLRMIVVAKGVTTNEVELHYGINYSVNSTPATVYRDWENPQDYEALHYPEPNDFIPTNLAILADDPRDKPYKLLDTEQGVFWFQQDTEFLRPKANFHLNVLTDKTNSTPKQALLSVLYTLALQESVNEWKYPILTAGLNFAVARNNQGLSIDISGYSDKLPLLISEIAKRLQEITIDDVTFAALKSDLKRALDNKAYAHGYQQVINMGNFILNLNAIPYTDYQGMIDAVTLTEVHTYSKELFKQVAFEGIAYGNLDQAVLTQKLNDFMTQLGAETLPSNQRKSEQVLKLNQKYTYSFMTESNNHALIRLVQMGERSHALDAQLRIINTHIGAAFFNELRSEQQLGYVVHAGLHYLKKVLGLRFIVQSSTHDPKQIDASINGFLPMMATQFAELTDEQLESYKQGVIAELQQPELTIADHHARLHAQAIKLDGDFDYRHKLIAELEKVTKDEIVTTWNGLASKGQLSVSLFAKGTTIENLPHTTAISNLSQFKQSRPIYE